MAEMVSLSSLSTSASQVWSNTVLSGPRLSLPTCDGRTSHTVEPAACGQGQWPNPCPWQCAERCPWQASGGPPQQQAQNGPFKHECPGDRSVPPSETNAIGSELGCFHRDELLGKTSERDVKRKTETNGRDGHQIGAVRGKTCTRATGENVLFRGEASQWRTS
eukprot:4049709-Amphidinium_carterae.2